MRPAPGPVPFAIGERPTIRGEREGVGPPVVLCHGITATRRYVLHGSRVLERAGHRVISYDARGHGESEPAPAAGGYGYAEMIGDLEAVIAGVVGEGPFVLAGHSMGCHTAIGYTLRHPRRVAGLVAIGPVYAGPISKEALSYWDGLAVALQRDGVDGFVDYIGREQGIDPAWRETVLGFTRTRMLLHRHPEALVDVLRQIPRSRPFGSLEALREVEPPSLVIASRDEADPGHPRRVATAYCEQMPRASLICEAAGESPLAWQGGKLSREIANFCDRADVTERFH
jgi:pimeloyl-ACP methyl ester carboxylesterase